MFELKLIIQAKSQDKRVEILSLVEEELRDVFGSKIVDVSRWGKDVHNIDDEFLVSVNYNARDPHEVRAFVSTTLRLRVVSLTNLVTKKHYPTRRNDCRKKALGR